MDVAFVQHAQHDVDGEQGRGDQYRLVRQGLSSREAIYQACLKRFRPIVMTTLAAMLGAVPLAIGFGEGDELRRPLGISIVGGLMVSQVLTLYTTPVIYLYLDRFRLWAQRRWRTGHPRFDAGQVAEPGE